MITERGPHGTVAVVTIESDKEVVLHALFALQNRSCRHCLPVYLREVFGQKQVCLDCTGLISIADPESSHVYSTVELRRNAIADLLESIGEVLDMMLDPSDFVFHPENVWIHPQNKDLFFSYLPIRLDDGESRCFLSRINASELESLLMHDFFTECVPEECRHRIIDSVSRGDEKLFLESVDTIRDLNDEKKKRLKFLSPLAKAWLVILATMLIALFIMMRLSVRPDGFWGIRQWGPVFVAAFLLSTFFAYVRYRANDEESSDTTGAETSSKSKKELFFPDPKAFCATGNKKAAQTFEPGFLIEQADYGKRAAKKRQGVIWTDDFLIGSDHLLCDFPINHPSVSARHARIVRRQGLFYLVDLGSLSGTFIGHRKLFTHEENPLSDQDSIRIGEVRFRFSFDERFTDT
ncbi:MAG: FHA domain-containing protein [Clostridiales bacterium]|nr:FHA domain-containing protein [Clostridiales bacterium]